MYKVGDKLKCIQLCICGCLNNNLNNIGIITHIVDSHLTIKFSNCSQTWSQNLVRLYFKPVKFNKEDLYLPPWF